MQESYLSVAPMIQWTDRHWRYYVRGITQKTTLYTEMVMDDAVINNPLALEKYIGHSAAENPLVLQLGGCDPTKLGDAAALCERYGGFKEINLNCGCPSDKAKSRDFGASLMMTPDRVREIVHAMSRRCVDGTPITVKCRLGAIDSYKSAKIHQSPPVQTFVAAVKQAGCSKVIVHARDCLLRGLTPAQNRTVPPLRYSEVHELCSTFPDMEFVLNGGVDGLASARERMRGDGSGGLLRGVMIGRAAYKNPFILAPADQQTCGGVGGPSQGVLGVLGESDVDSGCCSTRMNVVRRYLQYADGVLAGEEDVAESVAEVGPPDGDEGCCCDSGAVPSSSSFSSYAVSGRGGNTLPKLCKPLHHALHGCSQVAQYKQALDLAVKGAVKSSHRGTVAQGDFVHSLRSEEGGGGPLTAVFESALGACGTDVLAFLMEPLQTH